MPPSSYFFQAEDGIRAKLVTGVQTCALPILSWSIGFGSTTTAKGSFERPATSANSASCLRIRHCSTGWPLGLRSEERRVGKECRCRGTVGTKRYSRTVPLFQQSHDSQRLRNPQREP